VSALRLALHRLDARIERIEAACGVLSGLAREPAAAVLDAPERVAAMERMLEVGVQAATDVAAHIIAAEAWQTPESAGQAFAELARRGVLDPALATRLRRAVGLRNVLAHDYLDVDAGRLFASLTDDVSDLRAFVAATLAWIASRSRD
jgi:uncharacterized protein YutE (UPF0331/DUF86 family)